MLLLPLKCDHRLVCFNEGLLSNKGTTIHC